MTMIFSLNFFGLANFIQKVHSIKYVFQIVLLLFPCLYIVEYSINFYFQIKNYYKFRVKHKKLYEDLSPHSLKHVFEHDILHLHPTRDQLGRRILLLEIGSMFLKINIKK